MLGLLDGPQSSFAAICGAAPIADSLAHFTRRQKQTWSRFAMPFDNERFGSVGLPPPSRLMIIFISGRDDPLVARPHSMPGVAFAKPDDENLVRLVQSSEAAAT